MTDIKNTQETRTYSRVNGLTLITIALLCIKAVLQLYLFSRGFLSVSADEYSRGIMAARWALDGTLSTRIRMGDWLPFETYLNGLSLMAWDNVIWTPRITAFVFSCFLLVYFLKLVQHLFGRTAVTLLAGLFLVFNPWFIWLSGTPMLEIYYLAPFVAGLYYVTKWLAVRRDRYLIIGGFLFFFSTGFHSQSWILVNVVNLCLCYFGWRMLREIDYRGLLKLAGFFILCNLFIIIYIPSDYLAAGQWLAMFHRHARHTMEYYGGYEVGLFHKLSYYPRLVAKSATLIWIFFPIGLYWLRGKSGKRIKLFPLAVGLGALFFYSVFNALSVPASAAPGRYSLPFFILLVPYSSLGIYALIEKSTSSAGLYICRAAAAALVIYMLNLSFIKALDFEVKSAKAAVTIGQFMRERLEKDEADSTGTVMVELSYWDYLYVELPVRHYDRVRYDREVSDEFTGTPSSLLSMNDGEILAHMRSQDTKLIAAKDDALKNRLDGLPFMHKIMERDVWALYGIDPEEDK